MARSWHGLRPVSRPDTRGCHPCGRPCATLPVVGAHRAACTGTQCVCLCADAHATHAAEPSFSSAVVRQRRRSWLATAAVSWSSLGQSVLALRWHNRASHLFARMGSPLTTSSGTEPSPTGRWRWLAVAQPSLVREELRVLALARLRRACRHSRRAYPKHEFQRSVRSKTPDAWHDCNPA